MKKAVFLFTIFFLALVHACNVQDTNKPAGAGGWLKGNTDEKFETIASQLRGFDMAMVETGYRYQELYWAGEDQNWDYAKYQLDKMQLAIKDGLLRRPKRAASAQSFLDFLPELQTAIEAGDTTLFNQNFQTLTLNCIRCHAKEQVPFFTVQVPTARQSPIKK